MSSFLNSILPKAGLAASSGPQKTIAFVWTAMGLGTMLYPKLVLDTFINKAILPKEEGSDNKSVQLAISCFGAQAVVVGGLLSITQLDKRGYALFGIGMIPFFFFDYLAYKYNYITSLGALGDLFGNIVFITCSFQGAGYF